MFMDPSARLVAQPTTGKPCVLFSGLLNAPSTDTRFEGPVAQGFEVQAGKSENWRWRESGTQAEIRCLGRRKNGWRERSDRSTGPNTGSGRKTCLPASPSESSDPNMVWVCAPLRVAQASVVDDLRCRSSARRDCNTIGAKHHAVLSECRVGLGAGAGAWEARKDSPRLR